VVRGMCALRPGVPGLSENIRVRSVLGRFLEHSRVYVFGDDVSAPAGARTAPEPAQVWIGSADMMHRNLDRRVEVLVRIGEAAHRSTLIELIDSVFTEDAVCWTLGPDGEWTRHTPPDGVPPRDVQKALIEARNQQSAARRARMG
jgi:polyphosphate kinase